MVDYQIPITYVVSASAVTPQQGLEPLKLSTVLLLTTDEPVAALNGSYITTKTVTGGTQYFGTETETAMQLQAIFAQQPNILANDGYVIIAPLLTNTVITPATAGTLTTKDLSSNLAALIAVSNGDLKLTIDGTATTLTDIDLTGATTLADVAEAIQEKTSDVLITVEDDKIIFRSQTTGTTSSVTISAASGTGTDLYGSSYLDGANATAVSGTAAVTGTETISAAITRLAKEIYFEGILTTKAADDAEMIAASNLVQSLQNRVLPLPRSNSSALSGIFATVQNNTNTKCLYYSYGENPAQNARIFAAAYLSKAMSVNYNGSNTTMTMNLKDLAIIQADTNISESIYNQCAAAGADCFPSIEGLAKVISNSQGGMFFDQVLNQIWFVNTIQRNVFNVLATTRTKIAQTDANLEIITKTIRQVCNQAVTNNYIAPGTWNSSDTFGNYNDFYRNIEEFGYYIYHQPVAEQSQTERQARKAPVYQIAAKESGAVHSANILIYIEA